MKAITIHQPWAWMIVHGHKRVENRTWQPDMGYRGPLAIHAGKKRNGVAADIAGCERTLWTPNAGDLVYGAILGVVDLANCLPVAEYLAERSRDPFASGPWCWVLTNPRPLTRPIPYRGQRRLFQVPNHLLSHV